MGARRKQPEDAMTTQFRALLCATTILAGLAFAQTAQAGPNGPSPSITPNISSARMDFSMRAPNALRDGDAGRVRNVDGTKKKQAKAPGRSPKSGVAGSAGALAKATPKLGGKGAPPVGGPSLPVNSDVVSANAADLRNIEELRNLKDGPLSAPPGAADGALPGTGGRQAADPKAEMARLGGGLPEHSSNDGSGGPPRMPGEWSSGRWDGGDDSAPSGMWMNGSPTPDGLGSSGKDSQDRQGGGGTSRWYPGGIVDGSGTDQYGNRVEWGHGEDRRGNTVFYRATAIPDREGATLVLEVTHGDGTGSTNFVRHHNGENFDRDTMQIEFGPRDSRYERPGPKPDDSMPNEGYGRYTGPIWCGIGGCDSSDFDTALDLPGPGGDPGDSEPTGIVVSERSTAPGPGAATDPCPDCGTTGGGGGGYRPPGGSDVGWGPDGERLGPGGSPQPR